MSPPVFNTMDAKISHGYGSVVVRQPDEDGTSATQHSLQEGQESVKTNRGKTNLSAEGGPVTVHRLIHSPKFSVFRKLLSLILVSAILIVCYFSQYRMFSTAIEESSDGVPLTLATVSDQNVRDSTLITMMVNLQTSIDQCHESQTSLRDQLEKMQATNAGLVMSNNRKDAKIAELTEKLSSTEGELEEEKAKLRFKALETTDELIRAVDTYIGNDALAKAAVQEKYGPVIGSWNVSTLTNFDRVFWGCRGNRNYNSLKAFNEDLSGWDVSRATSMVDMFHCANAFNQPLSSWDVSRVSDMGWMFYHASNFNQPLSSWDVSRVSTMYGMFYQAASYNNDLSGWTIRNGADTLHMFDDARLMDSSKKPRGVE